MISETRPKLSIIIPVFNEEHSLEELNTKILQVLFDLSFDYEIIYIDDGSTDKSFEILEKLHLENPRVKVIQFKKNFGKSAALACGFKEAGGDLIITMDADLQDEPEEIPNLINKINEGYDLVSGWKEKRKDSLIKLISSKIFNFTASVLLGLKLHDFNCGFKIYRKEVVKDIDVYGEMHRFLPALASQKGFKIAELKVRHSPRKFGESKYGKLGLRRLNNYLLDIINVLLITKYAQKPLHFFGGGGLLLLILGFVIEIYLIILRLLTGSIQNHYPLLMLGILLIIVGIQLISLGFLSEVTTHINKRKENNYFIKNVLKK